MGFLQAISNDFVSLQELTIQIDQQRDGFHYPGIPRRAEHITHTEPWVTKLIQQDSTMKPLDPEATDTDMGCNSHRLCRPSQALLTKNQLEY